MILQLLRLQDEHMAWIIMHELLLFCFRTKIKTFNDNFRLESQLLKTTEAFQPPLAHCFGLLDSNFTVQIHCHCSRFFPPSASGSCFQQKKALKTPSTLPDQQISSQLANIAVRLAAAMFCMHEGLHVSLRGQWKLKIQLKGVKRRVGCVNMLTCLLTSSSYHH